MIQLTRGSADKDCVRVCAHLRSHTHACVQCMYSQINLQPVALFTIAIHYRQTLDCSLKTILKLPLAVIAV